MIRAILYTTGILFVLLLAASIADILLVFIYPRFYSSLLFIVLFGVAGVFAGLFSFSASMNAFKKKNEAARWSVLSMLLLFGVLFFFLLARLEGGEYEPAFKSFGVCVGLAPFFLFSRGKLEF